MKTKKETFIAITIIAGGLLVFLTLSINSVLYFKPRSAELKQGSAAGAVEWLQNRRANTLTGVVDPIDVNNAMQQVEALRMQKGTSSLNLSWIEMGPDNFGGRTRAILIDKDDHSLMFAGGVSGGLWKSTSAGSSWTKVNDLWENLAVTCITQACNGDLYVGTGEGLAQPIGTPYNTGSSGQGIWKSSDKGVTWTHLSSTWTIDSSNTQLNNIFSLVNRLAAHRTDPVKIYAATAGGLMVTNDGGTTWVDPLPYIGGSAKDVKVGSDGTAIACVGSSAYVSHSGDNDVFELKSGSSAGMIAPLGGRLEFAISPSAPETLYCSATKGNGSLDKVYRSTDSGNTWSSIAVGSTYFDPFGANNQGWFDNALAVFPNDPNKVLLGGVDLWMWQSGGSFEQITVWNLPLSSPYYVHADIHAIIFHPDYNGTTNKTMYVGCDGGIFRSSNGANTFEAMNVNYNVAQCYSVAYSGNGRVMGGTQDNGTLYIDFTGSTPQAAVNILAGDGGYCDFSMLNPDVMFATVYYGEVRRSNDNGATMPAMYMGSQASFVTPIRLWESYYDTLSKDSVAFVAMQNYAAGDIVTAISRTNNLPLKYPLTQNLAIGDTIYVKDTYQSMLVIGLSGKIGITRKPLNFSTTSVNQSALDIPDNELVQTLEFSKDGNYLYIATSLYMSWGSNLYRVSDISQARTSVQIQTLTATLIKTTSQTICGIAVDPANPDKVLLTLGNYGYSNYVLYSQNATSTSPVFSSRQGNLPKAPVYCGIFEYTDPNKVIIGTEFGVYSCSDITASSPVWCDENANGFANVPVYMIRQQTFPNGWYEPAQVYTGVSNEGVIYTGTHGRGIFRCETFKNPSVGIEKVVAKNNSIPSVTIFPNPVSELANINIETHADSDISIKILTLQGKLVKSFSYNNQAAGKHSYNISVTDFQKGAYIVFISACGNKLSSKFVVI